MGVAGVITAFILMFLHAVGLYRLFNGSDFQTAIIVVAGVLAIVSLLAILLNKRWGWPLALVVFSLGLANGAYLFATVGGSITLALLFGVTVFAMLVSFIAVDLWEPEWQPTEPVQTFEPEHVQPDVSVSTTVGKTKKSASKKAKKTKKAKKSKKKASR